MEKKNAPHVFFPSEKDWLQFVNRNRNNYLKLDNQVLATYNAELQKRFKEVSEKNYQLIDEINKVREQHIELLELYHANFTSEFFSNSQTLVVTLHKN